MQWNENLIFLSCSFSGGKFDYALFQFLSSLHLRLPLSPLHHPFFPIICSSFISVSLPVSYKGSIWHYLKSYFPSLLSLQALKSRCNRVDTICPDLSAQTKQYQANEKRPPIFKFLRSWSESEFPTFLWKHKPILSVLLSDNLAYGSRIN